MIEILDSKKHLVALRLSDSLTADDIEKAYRATDEALKQNERISFFAEIDDSVNLTFEGLFKDMVEGIWQFGKLKHYYRAAVVTNKSWIAGLARVEGLVFSSIDVRVFGSDERDKAFAWASEEPQPFPKPEDRGPAIHLIQTTNENVFAYEVDGPIREKDIETAVKGLNEAFGSKNKINVLGRMKNWAGFDLVAVLSDELFKTKYRSLSKVDKYAVVGPKPWMRNFLELINPVIGPEIRVFDADEENSAWEWVGAQQALLPGKAKKA
ncbi:MAG: STAS/SEC14 domain-containing protein [Pyrinomonadaceae bacterium]